MQHLHSIVAVCDVTMQHLLDLFTVCEMTMQHLRGLFGVSEMIMQPLHSLFTGCSVTMQHLQGVLHVFSPSYGGVRHAFMVHPERRLMSDGPFWLRTDEALPLRP